MSGLIVGVDGSKASEQALRWAAPLAGRLEDLPLLVAAVYVADPGEPRGWDDAHALARRRLEEWSEPARDAGVAYRSLLLDGDIGPALLEAIEESAADLAVIGRRGTGGFDALMAGSTADYLAHHIRRPLAIVPPAGAESPPGHLLVALDGSNDSAAAATWAAHLSRRLGAAVTAAYVPEPPELSGRLTEALRRRAETSLRDWSRPLWDAGLETACRVVESRYPADALAELAHEAHAAVIVAGTRPLGGLRPIRLGGVTMQLLHHSDVPVIIVPRNR